MRKETVNIDILITSRTDEKKTMQNTRIVIGPATRVRKWNQFRQLRWTSTKTIPIKKLILATLWWWDKGYIEAVSDGLTVLLICFCSLHILVAARSTSLDMTAVFEVRPFFRFIEINSNLRGKKFHTTNQDNRSFGAKFSHRNNVKVDLTSIICIKNRPIHFYIVSVTVVSVASVVIVAEAILLVVITFFYCNYP